MAKTFLYDPVNPIIGSIGHVDYGGKELYMNSLGITKREYAAIHIAAGMAMMSVDAKVIAKQAVEIALAVIEELNK